MKRRVGVVLLILLGFVVFDAIFVVLTLEPKLRSVQASLLRAKRQLEAMDLQAAASDSEAAREASLDARSLTRHPAYLVGRLLPGISRDLRAVSAVIDAAVLTSSASIRGVSAAARVSQDSVGDLLYADGAFDLDLIRDTRVSVVEMLNLLTAADRKLREAPQPALDQVQDALTQARGSALKAVESTGRVEKGLRLAPTLLGEDEAQRYVLAFQSPSEARGTGGLIGYLGILQADRGRLELVRRFPVPKRAPRVATDAPDWYRDHYGPLGALRDVRQVNLSPHFPVVARTLSELLQPLTGRVDGVLAMDPVVFGELTTATGPVSAKQLPVEVTADNAREVLLRRSYEELEPDIQNRYLATLLDALWNEISTGDLAAEQLVESLGNSAESNRLKVWVSDHSASHLLRSLGMDGWVPDEQPNVQMVWHNQVAPVKVDYFLRRSVETRVQLLDEGAARVEVDVHLTNDAPASGEPSVMWGPGFNTQDLGENLMDLHFLLPEGAKVEAVEWPDRQVKAVTDLYVSREAQFPVWWQQVRVPAGATASVALTYTIPKAVSSTEGALRFSLSLLPHTVVNPDRFELTISAPPGYVLADDGTGSARPSWSTSGNFEGLKETEIELLPE